MTVVAPGHHHWRLGACGWWAQEHCVVRRRKPDCHRVVTVERDIVAAATVTACAEASRQPRRQQQHQTTLHGAHSTQNVYGHTMPTNQRYIVYTKFRSLLAATLHCVHRLPILHCVHWVPIGGDNHYIVYTAYLNYIVYTGSLLVATLQNLYTASLHLYIVYTRFL